MTELEIRPVRADEYMRLAELVATVFARGDTQRHEGIRAAFARADKRPDFAYERHLIGVVDGTIVSHVLFYSHMLRLGIARIALGGIGAVATHPDYRGRGYAQALLRASVEQMIDAETPLALLDGIPNYYNRIGFTHLFPHYTVEIATADALALSPGPFTLRPPTTADLPDLMRLFALRWDDRPTLERPESTWQWRIAASEGGYSRVVVDADGQLRGYILNGGDGTNYQAELVTDGPEATHALLRAMADVFAAAEKDVMRWVMLPDDPFIDYARRWLTVTAKTTYGYHRGWMFRVAHRAALEAALLPEIAARFNLYPADVSLAVGAEQAHLALPDLPPFSLSHGDLFRLLVGAARPDSLDQPAEVQQALARLTPSRPGMVAPWDWF